MKVLRVLRCGLLAAAMTLPLVACDSQETADSPPEVTSTGSPATEGTGPEEPGKPVDGVSVSLPGVPVGGDADDDSQVQQCVTASWLGDEDIPEGVFVVVTGVRVVPADVFDIDGSSCGGIVGCTESFAFTAEQDSCSVSITATATEEREADLLLSGKARCVDRYAQRCKDLAANSTEKTIALTQPYEPPDEETNEETDEETDEATNEETSPDESPPGSTG